MTATTSSRSADFVRLVAHVCRQAPAALPAALLHEAKRLLLHQLSASAEAAAQPAGQRLLHSAAAALSDLPEATDAADGEATIWWTRRRRSADAACAINQQLCRLQPHSASHLRSLYPLSSDGLPALLAQAEAGRHSGRALLRALAIGVEVELALAALHCSDRPAQVAPAWPGPSRLGAAAAHCHLAQLDPQATAQALLAASAGDAGLLAVLGAQLPAAHQRWRMQDLVLHSRPLPLLALAPVEAALALRQAAPDAQPQRLTLALSPAACDGAAAAQLPHCVAAAWLNGQFTLDEWQAPSRADAATAALRERIALVPDPALDGVDRCVLSVQHADGSSSEHRVDALPGAPSEPLRDAQLAELFRQAADALVLPRRSGEILYAVWGLDSAPDVSALTGLLHRPG